MQHHLLIFELHVISTVTAKKDYKIAVITWKYHFAHIVFSCTSKSAWNCVIVDYINIRGTSCNKCSIPLYSDANWHLHIDASRAKATCGRFSVPEVVTNQDVFGNYRIVNSNFSCSENSSSPTNWWIGGVFYDW